jgi:succinate dehydrogenase/fumarate reductase flavoprotein subunit
MLDYAGHIRNETLLKQGLSHLRRLKAKADNELTAKNPHEMGRSLEVLNMLEIGELTFLMALDRKETRGLHVRPDYPFTNPILNKAHTIERNEREPVIQWSSY